MIFKSSQEMKQKLVNQKSNTVNYDLIFDHIGQFGWSQIKIVIWLSFVSAASGLAVVSFVFTGYSPNIRCHIPECEERNATYFVSHINGSQTLPSFYLNREISIEDQCLIPDYKISEEGEC